eukprot:CAMPEP_0194052484 /NCGR_PEP_ID=MMETSP0009_2-20130614/45654_1 /TAXON_ID=210454 /ORGANISM="Grammatophora oceanica, Strain CCMP 410" /LENGTH=111 /DNA_ID=CAMNT_0038700089 /DNA_START=491 /DNA_END=824 /DNA_ORIENTATION=-
MSWANKLHLLAYDLSGLRAETRRRVIDAGIMDLPALPERWATAQGLEPQVGVCYIGNFYLFKLVKPALSTAPLLLLQAALLLVELETEPHAPCATKADPNTEGVLITERSP